MRHIYGSLTVNRPIGVPGIIPGWQADKEGMSWKAQAFGNTIQDALESSRDLMNANPEVHWSGKLQLAEDLDLLGEWTTVRRLEGWLWVRSDILNELELP